MQEAAWARRSLRQQGQNRANWYPGTSLGRLGRVSPTPFDASAMPTFGKPLLKENVLDGRARSAIQVGGNNFQDEKQNVTGLNGDRPNQLTWRGGKELVPKPRVCLATLDGRKQISLEGGATIRCLEENALRNREEVLGA